MGVMDWVGGRHGYTTRTVAALGSRCFLPLLLVAVASKAVKTSEGLHSLCGTPTTNLLILVGGMLLLLVLDEDDV